MATNKELQDEEYEVLKSIYEGDEKFVEINTATFHYKFCRELDQKSFLVEFTWPENYPEVPPDVNLDFFCNKFLHQQTKNKIKTFIQDQAQSLLNSGMLYTIIEAVKENVDLLLEENGSDIFNDDGVLTLEELNIERQDEPSSSSSLMKVKEKKEQLTKAQKRRLLNRQEKGELPRGWNWVDIISHLSSTSSKDS